MKREEVIETLKMIGMVDYSGNGYEFSNHLIRVRVDYFPDRMDMAKKAGFDRWANSTDVKIYTNNIRKKHALVKELVNFMEKCK